MLLLPMLAKGQRMSRCIPFLVMMTMRDILEVIGLHLKQLPTRTISTNRIVAQEKAVAGKVAAHVQQATMVDAVNGVREMFGSHFRCPVEFVCPSTLAEVRL